ncbi:hypothetical protein KSF73_02290 [Burkholderiaceae bacterium DAT-1]|nr:hypothetical protein [Burkholderiaceae bacterium DAT-1]
MQFSEFEVIKSNRPKSVEKCNFEELCYHFGQLGHATIPSKDQAKLFSLTEFKPNQPRTKENAVAVTGAILDIDAELSPEGLATLKASLKPYAYILYTTFSSTAEAYKLRLVMPLTKDVPSGRYSTDKIASRIGKLLNVEVDPCSDNAVQIYYMPSHDGSHPADHFIECKADGKAIDVDALPVLKGHRTSSRTASNSTPVESDYLEAEAVIATYFGGISPYFSEGLFWVYKSGSWSSIAVKTLQTSLVNEHYKQSKPLREVEAVINVLTVTCRKEFRPEPLAHLIGCANGTVDLMTGELSSDNPENNLQNKLSITFDPQAACEEWLKFLEATFRGDADQSAKILVLQQYMGYMLTQDTSFQKMLWLWGTGSNGKSVITSTMTSLLGVHNVSVIPLPALAGKFNVAEMSGKLANISDEVAAGAKLPDEIIKRVVAGGLISAERKGKDPFQFKATAKLVVSVNSLPRSKDTSHGWFRRLIVLRLNNRVEESQIDRNLSQKLANELPGILNWAIKGYQSLHASGGFCIPKSSEQALTAYKEKLSSVLSFANHCLIINRKEAVPVKKFRIERRDLYKAYVEHCDEIGATPKSQRVAYEEVMDLLNVQEYQRSNGGYYLPCMLRTAPEGDAQAPAPDGYETLHTLATEFVED